MPYLVIGSDNREYGPADLDTLRAWASRGQVIAETVVVDTETGARFPASELAELRPLLQPQFAFPPAWTPPPAYAPRTLPPKTTRRAVETMIGIAVVTVLLVGVATVWVFSRRPRGAFDANGGSDPRGYRRLAFAASSEGQNGVLRTEPVTVVFQGRPIRGTATGLVQVAGPGQSSGMTGSVSEQYADGVATITVNGRTLRVEDAGKTMEVGGQRFDLRGGKKLVVVRPDGTAALVDPLAVPNVPPDRAYATTLRVWEGGDQAEAERLLHGYTRKYPNDQPLAFFLAACARSRFGVNAAAPLLLRVADMNGGSEQGKSAAAVLALDQHQDVEGAFEALRALARDHPNDPLPLWMLAVECRTYEHNDEGAACYAKLLRMVGKGSSLVHQTYANLLDALGKHREALPHRYLAVRLEPADWSYDGLAGTLDALGEHISANTVRELDKPNHKAPSLPADMVFSEAERRRLFDGEGALNVRLTKERHGIAPGANDPAFLAFCRRNHVTGDQMNEIVVEGMTGRWDSTARSHR